MSLTTTDRYDDIIGLEHHRSQRHPHMLRANRAAQFMPFAALTGYDEAIARAAQRHERHEAALASAGDPLDGDPLGDGDTLIRDGCRSADWRAIVEADDENKEVRHA